MTGTWIAPVTEGHEQIYYWKIYREEYILVARYIRRLRIPLENKPEPRDSGYWTGYLGCYKYKNLSDFIDLHRGPREWMRSDVIPEFSDRPSTLFGFSGQNFNDCNMKPSGEVGWYRKVPPGDLVILTRDKVFEILENAVEKYIENPVIKPAAKIVDPIYLTLQEQDESIQL